MTQPQPEAERDKDGRAGSQAPGCFPPGQKQACGLPLGILEITQLGTPGPALKVSHLLGFVPLQGCVEALQRWQDLDPNIPLSYTSHLEEMVLSPARPFLSSLLTRESSYKALDSDLGSGPSSCTP